MLQAYIAEYEPSTPTGQFFVTELAQAQWRIQRPDATEPELLQSGDNPEFSDIAAEFRGSDAIDLLARYAQAACRAYYKALDKLEALRARHVREHRTEARDYERRVIDYLNAPPPTDDSPVLLPVPPELQRELDAHMRQIPTSIPGAMPRR